MILVRTYQIRFKLGHYRLWLRNKTKLPIYVKGIITCEDAKEELKHDVQGIIVSSDGGRQLDGVPAAVGLVYLLFCKCGLLA